MTQAEKIRIDIQLKLCYPPLWNDRMIDKAMKEIAYKILFDYEFPLGKEDTIQHKDLEEWFEQWYNKQIKEDKP